MPTVPHELLIPDGMGANDVKVALRDHFSFREEAEQHLERVFYDTFDWRVHRAQGIVEEEKGVGVSRLYWRSRDGAGLRGSLRLEQPPRFAWDLPEGPVRNGLEPVLEMRALLPLVRLRVTGQPMRLLNKDQKTVLRLMLERSEVLDEHGKQTGSPPVSRVRVLPVRGYDKPAQRVQGVLTDKIGLMPAEENQYYGALKQLGRTPGDYASKLDIRLDPEMRADAATKVVLLHLLSAMELNEDGTTRDVDSEFLHDFRVAVRRTRSALSQIKHVFPARQLERFRADFAWLGQITGPTRDMDVYLLTFDEYRRSLPESVRDDLLPLRRFLEEHQRIEQRKLAEAIGSRRYVRMKDNWRQFLEAPVPARSTLPNAARPVQAVIDERIWRIYRLAIKEGRAIGPGTPAEALHELRKTCKKFRYLMEFFQSLYPRDRIGKTIKTLKNLQENLGDFQDFEVQVHTLRRFGQQMMEEGGVAADTLLAMGILVENLDRRQHAAREEFAARFTKFALPENRALAKALFAARRREEALAS